MAVSTRRNNIKQVFRGISLVMVIFCCWFAAVKTDQRSDFWQILNFNSSLNSSTSDGVHRVLNHILPSCVLALFAGYIFRGIYFLEFFDIFLFPLFQIGRKTGFTPTIISVFSKSVLAKVGQWQDLCAIGTSFCFRHGFFLVKKLCLGPLQAQYLCGSFYYTIKELSCQEKSRL